KKDIDLQVSATFVEIKVQSKTEDKKEVKEKDYQKDYHYEMHSMHSSQFFRRIPLPVEVQSEKAKAEYKNGMLRIEIPKKEHTGSQHVQIG
ncbi:hypothetical protein COY95_04800, partial [Candidatus Woesearchaeota archaeon CG_4_10_14_0_8_um_filter_47_5]